MDNVGPYPIHEKGFRQADSGPRLLPSPLSLIHTIGMSIIFFSNHTWHLLNVRRSPLITELMLLLYCAVAWSQAGLRGSQGCKALLEILRYNFLSPEGAVQRIYRKVLSPPPRKEVEFSNSKVASLQLLTQGRLDALPPMESSSDLQNLPAEPRTVSFQLMNYILKAHQLLRKAKLCYCCICTTQARTARVRSYLDIDSYCSYLRHWSGPQDYYVRPSQNRAKEPPSLSSL